MRKLILIIFAPARAASNFGCFGVFVALIYVIIVLGIILSVLSKMFG